MEKPSSNDQRAKEFFKRFVQMCDALVSKKGLHPRTSRETLTVARRAQENETIEDADRTMVYIDSTLSIVASREPSRSMEVRRIVNDKLLVHLDADGQPIAASMEFMTIIEHVAKTLGAEAPQLVTT